jgi:hypothetical protein
MLHPKERQVPFLGEFVHVRYMKTCTSDISTGSTLVRYFSTGIYVAIITVTFTFTSWKLDSFWQVSKIGTYSSREWGNGIIIHTCYGSLPHSLLSTSKFRDEWNTRRGVHGSGDDGPYPHHIPCLVCKCPWTKIHSAPMFGEISIAFIF